MEKKQSSFIENNQKEYATLYDHLNWPNAHILEKAEKERNKLLDEMEALLDWDFHRTKPYLKAISPGCRTCGDGTWSCLFVNGVCNASCFYCPTAQNDLSEPTTNTVVYSNPEDYIAYLEKFGFKGASISGGEPLITFEKTLDYLTKIRAHFGNRIYLWMYTNGILLDEEKTEKLKETGLDEIRFDIGAMEYNLAPARLAVGKIPNVTVEIPAVPEDFELMKEKLAEMWDMGLSYLNLHQIRCTPHNYRQLVKRGYHFLHGPKITVLESELTALRLMHHAAVNGIELPINYCSFIYKHRFQTRASRKRQAGFITYPYETVTQPGLIRTLSIESDTEILENLIQSLEKEKIDSSLWHYLKSKNKLSFHPSLWDRIPFSNSKLFVEYSASFIRPQPSYYLSFEEISLNENKKVAVERKPVLKNFELGPSQIPLFEEIFLRQKETAPELEDVLNRAGKEQETWVLEIYPLEKIQWGLYEYY